MLDRQVLIEETKQIQQNIRKIDLKTITPRTIKELTEYIRALEAIVEVVVSKVVSI